MTVTAASEATEITLTNSWSLRRRTPLFDVCGILMFVALVGAIVSRRPQVMALGAPFLVAVAAALAMWRPFDGLVRLRVDSVRVVEGDTVNIAVEVTSIGGLPRVELELELSDRLIPQVSTRAVTTVPPHGAAHVDFPVLADGWGVADIKRLTVRITDHLGMFGGRVEARPSEAIRIGLPEDRVQAALEADRFRRIVGSHLSNDRGRGLEIADIRRFQPGDSSKDINWRISNRRNEPWVTLRHPDRSTTMVVVVDAHDGTDDDQVATQRRSVAAAMALTRGHLALHDRVGLLVVGHTLRWLPPKLGRNQLFGIADELVAVGNAPEASRRMYRPPAVATIPNDAIVVAVSPLGDPRMVALIAELRSRDIAVSVLMPTRAQRRRTLRVSSSITGHAQRLAAAEQAIGVQSLREHGVPIVPWAEHEPVATVIESLQAIRQSMARARTW